MSNNKIELIGQKSLQWVGKNLLLLTVAAILLTQTACKKQLEEKSDTSLVVPATISDFQALLDRTLIMNMSTPSSGDAASDDYFMTPVTYLSFDDNGQKFYRWLPIDVIYSNDWSYSYNAVYSANLSLEGLNKIPLTSTNQSSWNNVKGSALFYRAYSFLNLVWQYAKAYDESSSGSDPGIALRLNTNSATPTTRASVSESYARVIGDAKQAINYLAPLPGNVFRPSKAAAYGLLARAYLSMRKYPEALDYADSCLQIQNYLMDYNGDNGVIDLSIDSYSPFDVYQFNKEIIFYSQPYQDINQSYQFYSGKVDTTLYASYDNNDWRKTGFFYPWEDYLAFKGSYTGYLTNYFSGIATDEMYLIRAECNARAGNTTDALGDLNTLLRKRWITGTFSDITATDATDALNKILVERRKELLYRCLRWIDIKRLNKESRNIIPKRLLPDGTIVTLQPNANYYALPLPKDIIDLTGIPQNPSQ